MAKRFITTFFFFMPLLSCMFSSAYAMEYGDVFMDSKRQSMEKAKVKAVLFPHWFHRIRFKCKVCHEEIFVMQKGANNISMRRIMDGEACGVCHNGLIAWEPLYCERCHSVDFKSTNEPKDKIKARAKVK